MAFNMFISYAGKDLKRLQSFLDGLDTIRGLEYYLFNKSKTPAKETKDDIVSHIKCSDAFLLFHSVTSKKTNFVQHEIGVAIGQDRPLLIVKLGRSKPDGMLKGTNYFDFSNEKKALSEMARLTDFISQKIIQSEKNMKQIQYNNGINWPLLITVSGLVIALIIVISKTSKGNNSAIPMKM